MTPTNDLVDTIAKVRELVTWADRTQTISREIDAHQDTTNAVRSLAVFLEQDVPDHADPAYVDKVYDAVRELLRLRLYLDQTVLPKLEAQVRDRTGDQTAIKMTLSVLRPNIDRLLDTTADLYVAASRWLGLDIARERIHTRFRELSNAEVWGGG